METTEEKSTLNLQGTLCTSCRRSYTKTCSWASDFEPVEGWKAEPGFDEGSYAVHSCPLFKNDAPNGPNGERAYYAKPVEDDNGAQELAAAIIRQAVKDYMDWYSVYIKVDDEKSLDRARDVERWIKSRRFLMISNIDQQWLVKQLRKRARAMAMKKVRRVNGVS